MQEIPLNSNLILLIPIPEGLEYGELVVFKFQSDSINTVQLHSMEL